MSGSPSALIQRVSKRIKRGESGERGDDDRQSDERRTPALRLFRQNDAIAILLDAVANRAEIGRIGVIVDDDRLGGIAGRDAAHAGELSDRRFDDMLAAVAMHAAGVKGDRRFIHLRFNASPRSIEPGPTLRRRPHCHHSVFAPWPVRDGIPYKVACRITCRITCRAYPCPGAYKRGRS